MKKKLFALLIALCLLITAGCSSKNAETTDETTTEKAESTVQIIAEVTEDTKYGSAIINITAEEFENGGFTLGDSCNFKFSSGYEKNDVPFFNGFYVKNGYPVIVAYPGYNDVRITLNNEGIWSQAELSEGDTVTITLNEKGKYSPIQGSLGQVYSFDRGDYSSDIEFCNFRALTGGNLKDNFLYRGASPVDNSRGRAAYTDGLLKEYGIKFIVDLADSDEDMTEYTSSEEFKSEYALSLYKNGNAALLDMSSSYQSDEYKASVAKGLKQMMESEGPAYIHCMEGKDRTGFVCMLIEALAGASYDEMRADYMITYSNYYGVNADETPEKFNGIAELYFDAFMEYLYGSSDIETLMNADYTQAASDYLISGGMTEAEVQQLIAYISK